MNIEEASSETASWMQKLKIAGVITETSGAVSMRCGDYMLISSAPESADDGSRLAAVRLTDLTLKGTSEPDPLYAVHAEIYRRKNISSVIHSISPAAAVLSKSGRELFPMIDDFAQIVGPSVKSLRAEMSFSKRDMKKLITLLRFRSAVFMYGFGAFCTGDSMDNAFAVAQVLEKGCRCAVESSFIGGERINPFIAMYMRWFYLHKYSKAAVNNRR